MGTLSSYTANYLLQQDLRKMVTVTEIDRAVKVCLTQADLQKL